MSDGELNEKLKDPFYAAKMYLAGCEQERDDLRRELEQCRKDGEGDARQIHGQAEKIKALELQVNEYRRALEEIALLPDSDYQDDGHTHQHVATVALGLKCQQYCNACGVPGASQKRVGE